MLRSNRPPHLNSLPRLRLRSRSCRQATYRPKSKQPSQLPSRQLAELPVQFAYKYFELVQSHVEFADMFECLKKINASSVCFALTRDDGKKSDFVGRVYGLLNAWDSDFHGALHFALENRPERIEQAHRLVKSIRPELIPDLRFWINY